MFPYKATQEQISKLNTDKMSLAEVSEALYFISELQDVLKKHWDDIKVRMENSKCKIDGWQLTTVATAREVKDPKKLVMALSLEPGWDTEALLDKGILKISGSEFRKAVTANKKLTEWPENLEAYLNKFLTQAGESTRLQKAKE